MPNWCTNTISVSNKDPEMMKKFADALAEEKLFQTLLPLSTEDGEWDYCTAVETWGCKWDASDAYFELEKDGLSGSGNFSTPWGPPIAAYEKLKELGFDIVADYIEPGMCFAGAWTNETGSESWEYDFNDENWREGITNDDVLAMLEDEYENWKEFQDEEIMPVSGERLS